MGEESHSTCPHCGAANQISASFCESCGKALPAAARSTPRLVTDSVLPASDGARQLVSEELKKNLKKAKGALLTVAILQTIVGAVLFAATRANPDFPPVVAFTVLGMGGIYFGLYAWARHQPLPAAIVGLILYITMHLLDGLQDPRQFARGIILKVIIVVLLVQAIQAGLKYKRMMAQAPVPV
jgi:hypothetical protein